MKFSLFKNNTPPLIGIDISSSSVKMVELSNNGKGGYRLESYAIFPLPSDAMVDGAVGDLAKVSEVVKAAYKSLGSKEKLAALALPTSSVISKKVLMPAGLSESAMEAQVESEATQYIPFPLEEVNIDFQVIGPAPDSEEEVEVLIAAAKKEKIEDRLAAAEGAGLKVSVMDVENYATEAAYSLIAEQIPESGKGLTVMIVDIGSLTTNITVLHDNVSVYNRDQSFGGNQLTLDIQRRFGISLEETEKSKRKNGLGLPDSYEDEVLKPFVEILASEVVRSIQFFTTSTLYGHIDHVVLAGGCAAIKDIDLIVQKSTQVNTILANPFKRMTISDRVNKKIANQDAPALMIACGLAMRGVAL